MLNYGYVTVVKRPFTAFTFLLKRLIHGAYRVKGAEDAAF